MWVQDTLRTRGIYVCSWLRDLLVIELSRYGCIHSRQWVIQQVEVSSVVHGPCQAHSCLLPTTECDSPLPHQCQVTMQQLSHILVRGEV